MCIFSVCLGFFLEDNLSLMIIVGEVQMILKTNVLYNFIVISIN